MARSSRRSRGRRPRVYREGAFASPPSLSAKSAPEDANAETLERSTIAKDAPIEIRYETGVEFEPVGVIAEAPRPAPRSAPRARGQLLAEVALVVVLVLGLVLYWPAPSPSRPVVPDLSLVDRAAALEFWRDPSAVQEEDDLSPPKSVPWWIPIPPAPTLAGFPVASAPPVRVYITTVDVKALAESVGVDHYGAMDVPSNYFNVGWYKLGPVPGDAGDAVLDGHVGPPDKPMVFGKLATIKPGDGITVVLADGTRRYFAVTSIKSWPWWAHPYGLFQPDGPARLTLITCSGTYDDKKFSYPERLVVEARYLGQG